MAVVNEGVDTSEEDAILIGGGYALLGAAELVGVVLYKFRPVTLEGPVLVMRGGSDGAEPLEGL